MTSAERSLAAGGRSDVARYVRRHLQTAMREPLVSVVERLTGCRVVAFMGDNHIEPDLAANVFVLDRPVPGRQAEAA